MSVVNYMLGQSFEHTCIEKIRTYFVQRQFYKKDFPKANPFTRFVRGKVEIVNGKLQATPVGLDKSSAISSLAEANAFIVLPGGNERI